MRTRSWLPVSTFERFVAGRGMVLVWLGALGLAWIGVSLVGSSARESTAPPVGRTLPATQPLQIRKVPLRLRSGQRMEVDLPAHRLTTSLTELAQYDFPRWNQLIHGLRLWGPEAQLPGKWNGKKMLEVVCSAERARKVFDLTPHVFNRNGLHFAHREDGGEKHLDETLSVLGEIGIRSDHPVLLFERQASVADAVRAAVANFVLDQTLEFSAVAFAHYLPPRNSWTNKFGQTTSFDDVCLRLCRQPMGRGFCNGCHAMYALAMILAADEQQNILTDDARRVARSTLRDAVAILKGSQRDDGTWDVAWFDPALPAPASEAANSLAVTGHCLEWLAVAPAGIVEDSQMVSRACEGLLTLILNSPRGTLDADYNAYTHAASALRKWSPKSWDASKLPR